MPNKKSNRNNGGTKKVKPAVEEYTIDEKFNNLCLQRIIKSGSIRGHTMQSQKLKDIYIKTHKEIYFGASPQESLLPFDPNMHFKRSKKIF